MFGYLDPKIFTNNLTIIMEKKKYNLSEEKMHHLGLLARYETAISNDFFRAMGILRKLQSERMQ